MRIPLMLNGDDPARPGVRVGCLDGDIITVTIPMAWKRRGGRKVIIAPNGGDAWVPAKPRRDETLTRALARALRWKRLLEDGRYQTAGEIAEAEKVTRSFVNRLLRLTLLAPNIQEAILDGRQAKGIQLEELTRAMPGEWEEQKEAIGRAACKGRAQAAVVATTDF